MARWLATALALFISLNAQAAEAGRRVALVIGNGAYAEAAALPNPTNDANAMADALKRLGFEVTLVTDAGQPGLLKAVDTFAQALPGAEAALLFYAGHGVQLDGQNYLLPVDIKIENERSVRYGALAANEIVAEMERSSPVNIVLLDACRNNPFVAELKRSLKSRAVTLGEGLAPIKATSSGTIIGFAAAAGEVAADGVGDHSPYTKALLAEMEKPGVEVALLLRRAAGHVIEETKGEQRPELLVRLVNEFYLKAPEVIAAAEVKQPETKPAEIEDVPPPVAVVESGEEPRYVVPRVQWARSGARLPDPQSWRPSPAADVAEVEENGAPGAATAIALDSRIGFAIAPKGDNDYFRFEAPRAGALSVRVKTPPQALDLVARLLDANLQVVGDWQAAPRPGGDLDIVFDVPKPGIYTLLLADNYNDAESADLAYAELKFTPADDGYEPNASIGQAWTANLSGEIKASIFPKGDQDWFGFWADDPGRFEVAIHGSPQALDMSLRLHNADGAVIYDWQVAPRPGGDITASFDLKLPGAYYLEIADSYNDARAPEPYTLVTRFTASPDIHEPNDSFAAARAIGPSGERRLTILPKGEADWFRIDVDHPGELKLLAREVPQSLDIAFRVYNRDKSVIADWMVPPRPGGDTLGAVDLPEAGSYYIEIADSYNDQADIQPFLFETLFTPEPDQYEPNNSIANAISVRSDGEFLFNILPRGDADWFALKVEAPGELKVSIDEGPPGLDLYYRIWNADRQVIRDYVAPYAKGGLTEGFADLPAAGQYFIEVVDGSNDARSVEPATLQTRFTAVSDAYEPNNSFGAASPVALDGGWQAHILPQGDADWFRLEAPAAGELTIVVAGVPEPLDIYFRVWDANGGASGWYGPAKAGGDFAAPVPLAGAGAYRIEVADGGNDGRSPAPFKVSWSFAAKP